MRTRIVRSLALLLTLAGILACARAHGASVEARPSDTPGIAGRKHAAHPQGPATGAAATPRAEGAWGLGLTDGPRTHAVRPGDHMTLIGARYGISVAGLARDNGLGRNAVLRTGQVLSIDARHIVPSAPNDGIVINVPQRMLFHLAQGRLLGAYPIAAGRPDWRTPRGAFSVIDRQVDKAWIVPQSIQREMAREGKEVLTRVEPGPDNPLGRHWIGLSIPGIGIHGTNAPASVYGLRSHGCIRLHPDDVAALHGRVTRGTPGEIVYHPALLAALPDGRIFAEVHPDAYRLAPDPLSTLRSLAQAHGITDRIDWAGVARIADAREGVAREVTAPTKAPAPPDAP